MLAKIVAYGETRDAAIARMDRALRETVIDGVNTTLGLCLDVLATKQFRDAHYDIGFSPRTCTRPRYSTTGCHREDWVASRPCKCSIP